jgi:hypothetical protein
MPETGNGPICLVNNWDLYTRNNTVYQANGQRRYVVSDLGSAFGRTGSAFSRSKGDLEDYSDSPFSIRVLLSFSLSRRRSGSILPRTCFCGASLAKSKCVVWASANPGAAA